MGLKYADRPWAGVQFHHPESVLNTRSGPKLLANFVNNVL
jgi:anthranilate synthase component 2